MGLFIYIYIYIYILYTLTINFRRKHFFMMARVLGLQTNTLSLKSLSCDRKTAPLIL